LNFVSIGAPGSGRTTQARKIAAKFKILQITTSDLLRTAVTAQTALGIQAQAAMNAGQLVPEQIVLDMIAERLSSADTGNGFILIGYPVNIAQARTLDETLQGIGKPLQAAILLDVDYDSLIQRNAGRRICKSCGQRYNIFSYSPRVDNHYDVCDGILHPNNDDNIDTINTRLRISEKMIPPLVSYYKEQKKLISLDGLNKIDLIFDKICGELDKVEAGDNDIEFPDFERKHKVSSIKIETVENTKQPEPSIKAKKSKNTSFFGSPSKDVMLQMARGVAGIAVQLHLLNELDEHAKQETLCGMVAEGLPASLKELTAMAAQVAHEQNMGWYKMNQYLGMIHGSLVAMGMPHSEANLIKAQIEILTH